MKSTTPGASSFSTGTGRRRTRGWVSITTRSSLSAIPFTPVTGPRLLRRDRASPAGRDALAALLLEAARDRGYPGVHVNFTTPVDQDALEAAGFLRREDCRFLWRNAAYRDFDDFLARFRADKRKKLNRERRRVAEAGVDHRDAARRGRRQQALGRGVRVLRAHLPSARQRALPEPGFSRAHRPGHAGHGARHARAPVAATGRRRDIPPRRRHPVWPVLGRVRERRLSALRALLLPGHRILHPARSRSVRSGTQGEHKLARGFEPTPTTSAHWLADTRLRRAIERYLADERAAVARYRESSADHLPFHRSGSA